MANIPPRYEPVDHGADGGIRAFGATLGELFENAAFGLFDTILDLKHAAARESKAIVLDSGGIEDLLVRWLSELNYIFQSERMLFVEFDVATVSATGLTARAAGEKWNPRRHPVKTEVKAVTYHDLAVEEKPAGWEAVVIFDL